MVLLSYSCCIASGTKLSFASVLKFFRSFFFYKFNDCSVLLGQSSLLLQATNLGISLKALSKISNGAGYFVQNFFFLLFQFI